jgi:ABC-type transport system substrate-binding protein
VESAIVQYPYDLTAAQRALQELGWTKGTDGVLRNAQGQEFRVRVTATAFTRTEREVNSAVAGWKELGIQMDLVFDPASMTISDEERVMRPGFGIIGGIADEFLDTRLSCETIPTPRNQFRGRNSGSWCNQDAQSYLDRLRVTIPYSERIQLIRGLVGVATTALPVMPIYWDIDPILAVAGVKNIPQPSAPTRVSTFNVWEWDKE